MFRSFSPQLHEALIGSLVPTESWEPKPSSLVANMANETTVTTMNDAMGNALVQPIIIQALSERPGLAVRTCREFDITNARTGSMSIPRVASYWGAPADRGAGVDAEFDGTEATAPANTAFSTDGIPFTPAEYVVVHALSDRVIENGALDAAQLYSIMQGAMLGALMLALDDDFVALASGLSNSVGATGVDLTLAVAISAVHNIITRGANCEAIEYVLDPEQVSNVHTAVLATNAAAAVYQPAADRLIGFERPDMATRGQGRVAMLNGAVVTQSGLADTANVGADVVGMAFVPSSAVNDANGATTFGLCWKRLPRFEQDRQAKGRYTDLVLSMVASSAELQDGSGTQVLSDAP